jgi:hypothetical protein
MHASVFGWFRNPRCQGLGLGFNGSGNGFGIWDPWVWKLHSGRLHMWKTAYGWIVHVFRG